MVTNNAINVATAATGKILQGAGVGVAPTFSTATYPSTAGTIGNVLTSDGTNFTSSAPSGGGSFVWISQVVSSSASTTEFALSGYNIYKFIYYNVTTSTNANNFFLEVSDDGGSTWKTSGYSQFVFRWNGGGTGTTSSTANIDLDDFANDWSSTNHGSGNFIMSDVGTSTQVVFTGMGTKPTASTGGSLSCFSYSGWGPTSLTVNRVRFKMGSGTHSGTFNLYGIKTS